MRGDLTDLLPPQPEFGAPLEVKAWPEVLRFLALRRSTPAVTLREPAPSPDQLQDLLRIAARAPDHGKLAPWRFVVLEGGPKMRFVEALDSLARSRGDATAAGKLGKLRIPPLAVAVVASPTPSQIPEWEQLLSAGAVATNLTYAALAMGFGANWITDWYAYDPAATAILGLRPAEKVAAFVLMGTAAEPPLERERPNLVDLVTRWKG
jgi:nitroreductase